MNGITTLSRAIEPYAIKVLRALGTAGTNEPVMAASGPCARTRKYSGTATGCIITSTSCDRENRTSAETSTQDSVRIWPIQKYVVRAREAAGWLAIRAHGRRWSRSLANPAATFAFVVFDAGMWCG